MIKIHNSAANMFQEGRESGLNTKIEQLSPYPKEVIALFFNVDKNSYENIEHMFKVIQEKFPNNEVIALPDAISLKNVDKYFLEGMVQKIQEVIEKL